MDKELLKLVNDLVETKTKYDVLIDYLINTATLNYSETDLRVDDAQDILKALEPGKYNDRLEILKCKKKITE